MSDCIFCRIISGELPSSKIYESKLVIAIMDIQPINSGHIIIIPKLHNQSLNLVDQETLSELMQVAQKIGIAYKEVDIKFEGFNLFLADGEAAFQEVPHVHLHIFPRYKGDGFKLRFSDSYHNMPQREELDKIAERIKSFI